MVTNQGNLKIIITINTVTIVINVNNYSDYHYNQDRHKAIKYALPNENQSDSRIVIVYLT